MEEVGLKYANLIFRFESIKKKTPPALPTAQSPSKWKAEVDKFRARLLELDSRLAQIEGNSRLNQEDEIKLRHMRQAVVSL